MCMPIVYTHLKAYKYYFLCFLFFGNYFYFLEFIHTHIYHSLRFNIKRCLQLEVLSRKGSPRAGVLSVRLEVSTNARPALTNALIPRRAANTLCCLRIDCANLFPDTTKESPRKSALRRLLRSGREPRSLFVLRRSPLLSPCARNTSCK